MKLIYHIATHIHKISVRGEVTFDLFVQKKFSESNISEDKERKKKVLLYLPSFTTVFSPPLLALRNVSTIISIFIDHE